MAKKVKRKARSGQKEKVSFSISSKTAAQQGASNAEAPANGVASVKERGGTCSHIDRGINLKEFSAKLGSSESLICEDCRGNVDGRGKKGKNKQGKKGGIKKPETKSIWVCLECGHFSCGGVGLPTTPQSHAVRHAKQNHHPIVIHSDNHQLLWCFSCSKLIRGERLEDKKHEDVFNEVAKIMKGLSSGGSTVDVEDVWFGTGTVTSEVKSDYTSSVSSDGRAGSSVRGFVNLGNTCFFNAIMQNLLSMNSLRDYYYKLDDSIGHLSAAMKKLFTEASAETSSRSTINPRSLFGTLCTKAPQFRGYQQHDSHELLRCLLDGLSTEELSARKHTKSNNATNMDLTFVDSIFGGRLSSTVSCLECGHSSTIYEPFLDLSLPVPTKKPPVRTQPATRGKKFKLPPKKNGKNLAKVSKEASTLRGHSASAQVITENSLGMSSAPEASELVLSSSSSSFSDHIDPNIIALDMGFSAEDLSAIQEHKGETELQSISADGFANSWLDYLNDQVSCDLDVNSEIDEVLVNQAFANEDSLENDAPLSTKLNGKCSDLANAVLETCLNNSKQINSHEPFVPAQHVVCQAEDKLNVNQNCDKGLSTENIFSEEGKGDAGLCHNSDSCQQDYYKDSNTSGTDNEHPAQVQDVNKQFNAVLSLEYSFTEEVVQCGADSGQQTCTQESNIIGRDNVHPPLVHDSGEGLLSNKEYASSSVESEVSLVVHADQKRGDNEFPSQIQKSEVQLLPSEEDASRGLEISSVVHGDEHDSLGFDGLGDLFNEPEISLDCKPLDHSVSNDASKSGVAGNSSESDPDVVDNADAPVSVESCLTLFMKPEFLSKDEHAWQCDNCSRVLQEQSNRMRRKTQNHVSNILPNGCQEGNPYNPMDVGYTSNRMRSLTGNLERAASFSDDNSLGYQRESYENGKCLDEKQPESEISMIDFHHESLEPPMITECPEIDSERAKCESNGSEPEVASSENLKAKRDATKTILINKPPSILTIHLKRFSQDARGRLSKLNGHVNFRESIDMKPYMDSRYIDSDECTYHLAGVVEHSGTMRGGHYVAYVRGTKKSGDHIWYYASDAFVRESSLEEVLGSEAYILFYQRT